MNKGFLVFFCCTFLMSCKCQKEVHVDSEVANEVNGTSSEKIRAFLREKNFEILQNTEVIIEYEIHKKLIEGTIDEYSNQIFLKDTLPNKNMNKLLSYLKNDNSYDWNSLEQNGEFNPNLQFLIRNASERLILLVDEQSGSLGFVNLEGQKVATITSEFREFLLTF